jgi:hypothetical protein
VLKMARPSAAPWWLGSRSAHPTASRTTSTSAPSWCLRGGLLLSTTWRFGVTWVPVVSLAVGAGARYRSDGTFTEIGIVPDAARESIGFELAASARVGLEYRAHRRATVGAYASVLASWGTSAPMLPVAAVSLGMSWVHYPGWW